MNLVEALRNKMRMLKEDALAVAHTVESAFAGQDEVPDDHLDKDLRQVFYDLQDEKILDVRRRDYVEDGRLLRGYFWHVRDDGGAPIVERGPEDPAQRLYRRLPEAAWEHRRPAS